jgi:chondroitin AC lyase
VFTTINQTLLKSEVLVSAGGKQSRLSKGKHALSDVSWVLQDSVAYLFPEPVKVELSNQEETGNWREINHQSWATTEAVKKDVFNIWINHGSRRLESGYAYMVVPGKSATRLDQYMASSGIRILSNTETLQAVTNAQKGITGLVFYKPGSAEHSGVSVQAEQPCLVMINGKGKSLSSVTVSDPTQTLKSLRIRIGAKVSSKTQGCKTTWDQATKTTLLEIILPQEGYAGKSVLIKF